MRILVPVRNSWFVHMDQFIKSKSRQICMVLLCMCLVVVGASSFVRSSPNASPSKTIPAMLQLDASTIRSVTIVRMGDGVRAVVWDKDQIYRILDRLGQVQASKDLGANGYTLTGFHLAFDIEDNSGSRTVSIQLDSSPYAYHAAYNGRFFEITDADTRNKLNDYFDQQNYLQIAP